MPTPSKPATLALMNVRRVRWRCHVYRDIVAVYQSLLAGVSTPMRTLVDIPDGDVEKLDALAAKGKRSRAAVIREAIKLHLVHTSDKGWIARGAGYWKNRDDIGDAVEYQRTMRADRDPD